MATCKTGFSTWVTGICIQTLTLRELTFYPVVSQPLRFNDLKMTVTIIFHTYCVSLSSAYVRSRNQTQVVGLDGTYLYLLRKSRQCLIPSLNLTIKFSIGVKCFSEKNKYKKQGLERWFSG